MESDHVFIACISFSAKSRIFIGSFCWFTSRFEIETDNSVDVDHIGEAEAEGFGCFWKWLLIEVNRNLHLQNRSSLGFDETL